MRWSGQGGGVARRLDDDAERQRCGGADGQGAWWSSGGAVDRTGKGLLVRRQHGGEDGRRVVINRRDEEGKERGAAARSREVGEARHGEKGRVRVVTSWFVGCQMLERFSPGDENDTGARPRDKKGNPVGLWVPKGALDDWHSQRPN
jgi:hypothetical protein